MTPFDNTRPALDRLYDLVTQGVIRIPLADPEAAVNRNSPWIDEDSGAKYRGALRVDDYIDTELNTQRAEKSAPIAPGFAISSLDGKPDSSTEFRYATVHIVPLEDAANETSRYLLSRGRLFHGDRSQPVRNFVAYKLDDADFGGVDSLEHAADRFSERVGLDPFLYHSLFIEGDFGGNPLLCVPQDSIFLPGMEGLYDPEVLLTIGGANQHNSSGKPVSLPVYEANLEALTGPEAGQRVRAALQHLDLPLEQALTDALTPLVHAPVGILPRSSYDNAVANARKRAKTVRNGYQE